MQGASCRVGERSSATRCGARLTGRTGFAVVAQLAVAAQTILTTRKVGFEIATAVKHGGTRNVCIVVVLNTNNNI